MAKFLAKCKTYFLGNKRCVAVVPLLALLVVGLVFLPQFRYQYNSASNFTADNFSNPISDEKPVRVSFTAGSGALTHVMVAFTGGETPVGAGKSITLSLQAAGSDELLAAQVFRVVPAAPYTLPTEGLVRAGQQYVFGITTGGVVPEDDIRINMGTATGTDITQWTWGDTEEVGLPALSMFYIRYDIINILQFLFFTLGAMALVLAPDLIKPRRWRLAYHLFWLLASPLALIYMVEKLNYNTLSRLPLLSVVGNYILFLLPCLLVLALCNRFLPAAAAGLGLFLAFGIANHYVLQFRQTTILPSEIFGLGTAMDVMSQYSFSLTWQVLLAMALFAFLLAAAGREKLVIKRPLWRCATAGVCAVSVAASGVLVLNRSALSQFGVSVNYYAQTLQSKENGFLLNFALNLPDLVQSPPAGYSPGELAARLEMPKPAPLPANAPHIIVIMNEALADFSSFGNTMADRDPLPFIHQMAARDDSYVGTLVSPVFGSGTSCPEFEALTQLSLGLSYRSIAPYSQFVRGEIPALPRYMAGLGYQTLGTHPAKRDNWERGRVYPLLGFEDTAFLEAYTDSETKNGLTTDAAVYDYMIDYFEQNRQNKLFLFGVTIQNHGGYAYVPDVAEDERIHLPAGFSFAQTYLTMAQQSDRAFEKLINYFETVDEPVLVVMFGDHLPSVGPEYYDILFGRQQGEMSPQENMQYYSPLMVAWSNCGIDFSAFPRKFSANYLGAYIKQAAGLPLSAADVFQLQMAAQWPVISNAGVLAADGTFAGYAEQVLGQENLLLYESLMYNALFDARNLQEALFYPPSVKQ